MALNSGFRFLFEADEAVSCFVSEVIRNGLCCLCEESDSFRATGTLGLSPGCHLALVGAQEIGCGAEIGERIRAGLPRRAASGEPEGMESHRARWHCLLTQQMPLGTGLDSRGNRYQ
jgi:hypothetical protein